MPKFGGKPCAVKRNGRYLIVVSCFPFPFSLCFPFFFPKSRVLISAFFKFSVVVWLLCNYEAPHEKKHCVTPLPLQYGLVFIFLFLAPHAAGNYFVICFCPILKFLPGRPYALSKSAERQYFHAFRHCKMPGTTLYSQ